MAGAGGSSVPGIVGAVAVGAAAVGVVAVTAPVVVPFLAGAGGLGLGGAGTLGAVAVFLEVLQQLQQWGLINYRPEPISNIIGADSTYALGGNVNKSLRVRYRNVTTRANVTSCSTGVNFGTVPVLDSSPQTGFFNCIALEVGTLVRTDNAVCGTGTNVNGVATPVFTVLKADGSREVILNASGGSTTYTTNQSWVQTETLSIRDLVVNGVTVVPTTTTTPEYLDRVRPRLLPPTVPDDPILPPDPNTLPAVPMLPPAPPDRRPLAPPVTIPRPGQQPARVPVPGPGTTPRPSPGPSPTPSVPAPQQVPAVGPLPLPAPAPVPTTPGEVVVVDGQPIGGPAQAPAANLVAIAQELGRLERKAELNLQGINRAPTSDLISDIVAREVEALIRSLILGLFDNQPAGAYQLVPPCPPPGGGDPLPTAVVEWTASDTPLIDLRKRLDAVAELIQQHKNQGQPICKTPVVGEEVTVHFESDP